MNPEVLERYRKQKGLTITTLSKLMNRTPGWYSRIKDGKHPLPTQYIEPMANVFGVAPERLARELFAANQLESNSS